MSFLLFQPIHIPHPSSSVPAAGLGGMGGGGGVGGDCIGGGGVSPMGGLGAGRGRPLNLKMKFVCGQCWREGQVNEPDKNLKYCTAKARHRWGPIHTWTRADRVFSGGLTSLMTVCHGIFKAPMFALCFFSWTKERRVLLVKSFEKKKWVVVRPLPFSRTYPQQYDVSSSVFLSSWVHVYSTLFLPLHLSHVESSWLVLPRGTAVFVTHTL